VYVPVEMSSSEPVTFTLSRGTYGLGFNITGGVDQPHLPNDTGVFVTKIREQASAAVDGRLKEGDKILEVNDKSLLDLTHKQAVELFLAAGENVKLKVWHGAERELIDEYSKKLQKPKGSNGLKKLLVFASVVLLASISVYYAKRRNVA